MNTKTSYGLYHSTAKIESQSEGIKNSDLVPGITFVVLHFDEHIIHDSDCKQNILREGKPKLNISEKEEECCHRTAIIDVFYSPPASPR